MSGAVAVVLPWRKVFPRDRQSDPRRKLLSLEQQAVLDNLLDAAWLNGGTLPRDDAVLALLSMAGPRWSEIGPKVLAVYFERDGDVYVNRDLRDEMDEGSRRVEFNRERASRGAAARWGSTGASSNASSIAQSSARDMPPSAVSRSAVQENREPRTDIPPSAGDSAPPVAGRRARKARSKVTSNDNGALTVTATANGWSGNWVGSLVDLWRKHGEIKPGHLGKALEGLKALHTFEEVERGLSKFLSEGQARFGPEMFARSAGDWIAGRASTERKQQTIGDRMVEATSEFLKTEGGS